MSQPYFLSPAADDDLDDQAAYLAREAGIETAFRFFDAAASTFEAIGRMPGMGDMQAIADHLAFPHRSG